MKLVHLNNCNIIIEKLNSKKMSQKLQWKPVKTSTESTPRPCPRWGHSSCTIGQQIILFGGYANSVYMNDMWIFNTIKMQWSQLKMNGKIPTPRSNCTLNFDHGNGKLVLFGGGGENKTRFNQIYVMDWGTKQWDCIAFKEGQIAPWERTYHSAELIYPYLITFGGEGIADLDDLWVFNLQNQTWKQVTFPYNAIRPCGRRFHTSCIVGKEFYVVAGCYAKYRPLNDIYSIDLTQIIESGNVQGLQWKQRVNDQAFLTRWGHSSTSKGNNIYIFGGRFSNDLNDLLVLDTQTNRIKTLKVSNQTIPKPRRRSCLNFIGNCLLMFGGFNSDYYNDLHFINITQNNPKSNTGISRVQVKMENYAAVLGSNCKAELKIICKNGKIFQCHKGIVMQYFSCEKRMEKFIEKICVNREDQKDVLEMLEDMYAGYGNSRLLVKYLIDIPETQAQKQSEQLKKLSKYRQPTSTPSQSQKPQKLPIFKLPTSKLSHYLSQLEQSQYKDLTLILHSTKTNQYFSTSINKIQLMRKIKYFKNLFNWNIQNKGDMEYVEIEVPCQQLCMIRYVLGWVCGGVLVVDGEMGEKEWIGVYDIAEYFCVGEVKYQALLQLYSLISFNTVNTILQFAIENNLSDLALSCTRYQLLQCHSTETNKRINSQQNKNMYYRISFEENRFQIRQQGMTKNMPFMIKKINSSTQDMEVDKENNGETVCNQ